MPGRKLSDGRYELVNKIGHGGMGEVWLGRDTRLEREIAVKFIRVFGGEPDKEHVRRFIRESRITAGLRHPGVPAIYDGGLDENGWPFLVMERVRGLSVADLISEHGPLSVGWTAAIAAQVCAVLVAAHEAKLVHRDLKPSNLMLEPDGCVRVLDFGLATAPTLDEYSRITMTNQPLGSPPYMAPEQVEGQLAGPATDLYALGCTMYEMLTAEQIFSGTTYVSVMLQQVQKEPRRVRTSRPDVPVELEELISALLRKKPEERPASAEEVHRRLMPFVRGLDPLIGALDPPTATSPNRMYAGVLTKVFPVPALVSTVAVPPRTPPRSASPRPRPAITRDDLVKARAEARQLSRKSGAREAAKALEKAIKLAGQAFGNTDADVVRVRYDLAVTLFEGAEYSRAAEWFTALASDLSAVEGASDLLFDCRLKAATCSALAGQPVEALSQLEALLMDQRRTHGDDEPRTLELRKQIALLQLGTSRPQAARQTLTSLLAALRQRPDTGGPDPEEVARLLDSLPLVDEAQDVPFDDEWRDVLRYASQDEPGLTSLIEDLAGRGVPAPTVGFELGDEGWPAELAWPAVRIAVLAAGEPDDPETLGRDRAFKATGWDARGVAAWTADELAERIKQ